MAKYKLTDNPNVVIDKEYSVNDTLVENFVVLDNDLNDETVAYKQWLSDGNTPDAYGNEFYAANRAKAYPSIEDQLDKIYHEGVDAWKADIQAVKDKYPKP